MTAKSTGWLVAATFIVGLCQAHAAPPTAAKAVMIDSSASALSATKRVAITSVMVSFQASAGGEKTNTSGLFAAKTDTSATLQMPEFDTKLLAEITDGIYKQLQDDLAANGFEVVPEATVVASAGYQKIAKMAGISNFSKFANLDGDTMLVGASGLKPYLPYNGETGKFSASIKGTIKGWVGATLATSARGRSPPKHSRLPIVRVRGRRRTSPSRYDTSWAKRSSISPMNRRVTW